MYKDTFCNIAVFILNKKPRKAEKAQKDVNHKII